MPRGLDGDSHRQARDRCGLYFGLANRIQKLQKWTDPLGPRGLVVLGAFDALIGKIAAELPPFLQEHIAELFNILDDARAFACADVEPNAGARIHICSLREAMHDALIPPNGWRKSGNFSKNLWKPQTEIERDE